MVAAPLYAEQFESSDDDSAPTSALEIVESLESRIASGSRLWRPALADLVMMQLVGDFTAFINSFPMHPSGAAFLDSERIVEETRLDATNPQLFPRIVNETIEAQFGDRHATLRELGQNAIDAYPMQERPRVVLLDYTPSLERDGFDVLTVRDNGIGMRPEQLVRDLLIPYNSGKEFDPTKIGEHGIGWYSIADVADVIALKTHARDRIHTTSAIVYRDEREWRASIQPFTPYAEELNGSGTEITAFVPSGKMTRQSVKDHLTHYLGHVPSDEATVLFAGEPINTLNEDYSIAAPVPTLIDGKAETLRFGVSKRMLDLEKRADARYMLRNKSLQEIVTTQRGLFVQYQPNPFDTSSIHHQLFSRFVEGGLDFWVDIPASVTLTKGRNGIVAAYRAPVLDAMYTGFEELVLDHIISDPVLLRDHSDIVMESLAAVLERRTEDHLRSLSERHSRVQLIIGSIDDVLVSTTLISRAAKRGIARQTQAFAEAITRRINAPRSAQDARSLPSDLGERVRAGAVRIGRRAGVVVGTAAIGSVALGGVVSAAYAFGWYTLGGALTLGAGYGGYRAVRALARRPKRPELSAPLPIIEELPISFEIPQFKAPRAYSVTLPPVQSPVSRRTFHPFAWLRHLPSLGTIAAYMRELRPVSAVRDIGGRAFSSAYAIAQYDVGARLHFSFDPSHLRQRSARALRSAHALAQYELHVPSREAISAFGSTATSALSSVVRRSYTRLGSPFSSLGSRIGTPLLAIANYDCSALLKSRARALSKGILSRLDLFVDVEAKRTRKSQQQLAKVSKKYLTSLHRDEFFQRIMEKPIVDVVHWLSAEDVTRYAAHRVQYTAESPLRGQFRRPYVQEKISIDHLIDLYLKRQLAYEGDRNWSAFYGHGTEYQVDSSNPLIARVYNHLKRLPRPSEERPVVLEDRLRSFGAFANGVGSLFVVGPVSLLYAATGLGALEAIASKRTGRTPSFNGTTGASISSGIVTYTPVVLRGTYAAAQYLGRGIVATPRAVMNAGIATGTALGALGIGIAGGVAASATAVGSFTYRRAIKPVARVVDPHRYPSYARATAKTSHAVGVRTRDIAITCGTHFAYGTYDVGVSLTKAGVKAGVFIADATQSIARDFYATTVDCARRSINALRSLGERKASPALPPVVEERAPVLDTVSISVPPSYTVSLPEPVPAPLPVPKKPRGPSRLQRLTAKFHAYYNSLAEFTLKEIHGGELSRESITRLKAPREWLSAIETSGYGGVYKDLILSVERCSGIVASALMMPSPLPLRVTNDIGRGDAIMYDRGLNDTRYIKLNLFDSNKLTSLLVRRQLDDDLAARGSFDYTVLDMLVEAYSRSVEVNTHTQAAEIRRENRSTLFTYLLENDIDVGELIDESTQKGAVVDEKKYYVADAAVGRIMNTPRRFRHRAETLFAREVETKREEERARVMQSQMNTAYPSLKRKGSPNFFTDIFGGGNYG